MLRRVGRRTAADRLSASRIIDGPRIVDGFRITVIQRIDGSTRTIKLPVGAANEGADPGPDPWTEYWVLDNP